jgi:hypothetical protein
MVNMVNMKTFKMPPEKKYLAGGGPTNDNQRNQNQ